MLGVPDETVALWEAADEEDEEPEICWLMPENEIVLTVFQFCEWDKSFAGMNGVCIHLGIRAQEILATCRLLRAPGKDWRRILEGVRVMAGIIGPALNREAAERSG